MASCVPGGANRGDADEKAADWRMRGAEVARSRGLELRAETIDWLDRPRPEPIDWFELRNVP